MNALINIMIGYTLVIVLVVGGLTLLTGGFLFTFLQVKMSRGKKLLVQVRSVHRDYFRAGVIEEGMLVYKYQKEVKRLTVPPASLFSLMGVRGLMVDEERNAVVTLDFSVVRGFDPIKWDNLLKRALYRPSILDQKQQLMIILLIAVLLAVAFMAFMVYNLNGSVQELVNAGRAAVI